MFKHFFGFELRFWLRGLMVWIFFLILGLMFFGAASSDQIQIGGALGNTFRNAPWVVENFYAMAGLLSMLMTTAFVNAGASRDYTSNMQQIIFSTPLRKLDYLLSRYLGSALVSILPLLSVTPAILIAKHMSWVDPDRWGPVVWNAHLMGILLFAIPTTLFVASIVFAIAVLTRSTAYSFLGSILLMTGYGVSQALLTDVQNRTVAALLDPFGLRTFNIFTRYWTVADKNQLIAGYTGLLLWNRLIWLGAAVLVFLFTYWRFSFAEKARSKKKSLEESGPARTDIDLPKVSQSFGLSTEWMQFFANIRIEIKRLIKTTSFIVLSAGALLNSVPSLIFSANEGYGNSSLPVTYHIMEIIQGSLYIFLISMITYYAGVLVWEERDARTEDVQDALPSREWTAFFAKLTALLTSIALLLGIVMLAGIVVQLCHGYTRLQLGLYLSGFFVIDFSSFVFLAILAFFLHTITPNKYIGYFAYIAFLLLNQFIWKPLHVATYMVQFGAQPSMTYSDFFGYAPYLKGWLWFTAYWSAFCVLLLVLTVLLWQRGRETRLSIRVKSVGQRFTGSFKSLTVVALAAFVGCGVWIYYNTKILNKTLSEHDVQTLRADYEKTYKRYEKIPQPRVVDVKYAIDIYPESRNLSMHGVEVIQNKSAGPIAEIHFTSSPDYKAELKIPGSTLKVNDERLHYQIYSLAVPLQAGESRTIEFTVQSKTRGFENSVSNAALAQNGTFVNSTIVPQIGYQQQDELSDRNDRKKFGLKEKELMPALERNCDADCRNNYISNNSDWVNVDTVISTSADQIAIAPGSLEREWTENNRHYYHYKLDHYALNFYSFLSANYTVTHRQWNGIDIAVYGLKEHPWNVNKMLNSVEKSFAYYTKNFGPYPQKQARIVEFPRIASFAQAFPGTMPYSESIGFIANLEHPDDIDMVFYVVAHEMGHQWWAHQVVGANMQGATVLSETLAQYSALMTMEKEYGRNTMRKFLKYEMDSYLRSRGTEMLKERPLLRVESQQGYIHYRKGSVVMYYLREMIGEEAVNRALRKVLTQYGYKQPPYPTSYALRDALAEETPAQYQYLLKDLFDEITLFSNRSTIATAHKRTDGKYDITVDVETHKFKADEKGRETEVPVDDWIEIGALAAPEKGKKYGEVLYRQRMKMKTGKAVYTFTTDKLPEKAGIDPLSLLVDRMPEDNLANVSITK